MTALWIVLGIIIAAAVWWLYAAFRLHLDASRRSHWPTDENP